MVESGVSKLRLKKINRMQVLQTVWEEGPVSRVDLSKRLQITRAAVTQIVNALIEEGVMVEIGEAPCHVPRGERMPKGRRKILLDISPNFRFVLGAVIGEQEVTVGLCTMHLEILDKQSFPCAEHTPRKEILQFIVSAARRIMSNACLERGEILGFGVGVMPVMTGRMRVYAKDGILDFTELEKTLALPDLPPVFCGNAVWLLSLADADLLREGPMTGTSVYLHLGSRIHIAELHPEKREEDYLRYSYLTERFIVRPRGRVQDGYPEGSVRAQLSLQAMQARIAEVYSRERTPSLYAATGGYIGNVTFEQMYRAVAAGDKRCEEVVREIMQDWSVLLHNLVCCYQARRLVLHSFGMNEKSLETFRAYVRSFVGEETARRIELSQVEGKTDFLAGCALALLRNFYMTGGQPEGSAS